jgi:hypothetical protein
MLPLLFLWFGFTIAEDTITSLPLILPIVPVFPKTVSFIHQEKEDVFKGSISFSRGQIATNFYCGFTGYYNYLKHDDTYLTKVTYQTKQDKYCPFSHSEIAWIIYNSTGHYTWRLFPDSKDNRCVFRKYDTNSCLMTKWTQYTDQSDTYMICQQPFYELTYEAAIQDGKLLRVASNQTFTGYNPYARGVGFLVSQQDSPPPLSMFEAIPSVHCSSPSNISNRARHPTPT